MSLVVPDVGEVKLLDRALRLSAEEDLLLKLFVNNYTPVEGSVAGDFTEATGGGYASKTLTNGSWGAAATVAGVSSSAYAEQTFTFTGPLTTNPDIYGYYLVGAVSGTLYWAERASVTFTPGDTYKVTPKIEQA